jgi:hypothetical protein
MSENQKPVRAAKLSPETLKKIREWEEEDIAAEQSAGVKVWVKKSRIAREK